MFENRKLVISTQHEKEKVIAPILEKFLGVTCVTPTKFNTDMYVSEVFLYVPRKVTKCSGGAGRTWV